MKEGTNSVQEQVRDQRGEERDVQNKSKMSLQHYPKNISTTNTNFTSEVTFHSITNTHYQPSFKLQQKPGKCPVNNP